MTVPVSVVDAFAAARRADASSLVFEYLAATAAEMGRPRPSHVDQLAEDLQRECRDLDHVYRPPGTVLLAYRGHDPIGCVGVVTHAPGDAVEIKRLYVRPAHRGGIGRLLMTHAHQHAARHEFSRVVLSVLRSRTSVIGLYRRLGYANIEPYVAEPYDSMLYMERPVTQGQGPHQVTGSERTP